MSSAESPATTKAPRQRPDNVAGLGRVGAASFMAPALIVIGLFLIFPAVWTIYLGITNYRLTGIAAADPDIVGLENYINILQDPAFWNSLQLTFAFVLFSGLVGQMVLGFAIAWSLRLLKPWAKSTIETLVLTAWVVPTSVGAFLWLALLDRRDGTLNWLLDMPGTAWLIEYPMISIIIFNVWVGTAFSMLLFSSALGTVPPSQLESARMSGASTLQQLRDVMIPNIRSHILTNALLITLWTFNTFTPFLLTAGGPDRQTDILPVYIYRVAIPGGQLGVAAAVSLIMLLINLVIALVYMRIGRRR